eukprot:96430_1
MALSTGFLITIVYGSSQMFLLLLVAIKVYYVSRKDSDKVSCKSMMYSIWKERGVYSPVIIHIYDTATDIGVLYSWYKLSQYEKNVENLESLNMKQFFEIGIGFMIAYRSIAALMGMYLGYQIAGEKGARCVATIGGFFCGLLELNIFVAIYLDKTELADENKKPGAGMAQKASQLMECVLESLPEVIMQSVFVMRALNDETLAQAAGEISWLVLFSIFASLLSITNKYVWIDEYMMKANTTSLTITEKTFVKRAICVSCDTKVEEFKAIKTTFNDEGEFCRQCNNLSYDVVVYVCPNHDYNITDKSRDFKKSLYCRHCYDENIQEHIRDYMMSCCIYSSVNISYGYLIRVLWRLSAVTARFAILALLWVVMGGAFVIVIIPAMVVIWYILVILTVTCAYANCKLVRNCCQELCEDLKCKTCKDFCVLTGVGILIFLGMAMSGIVFQLGILGLSGKTLYIVRMIENVMLMATVTTFAFIRFDCDYCADQVERSAMNNVRILIWIASGWIGVFLHIVTSFFVSGYITPSYEFDVKSMAIDVYGIKTEQKQQQPTEIQLETNTI